MLTAFELLEEEAEALGIMIDTSVLRPDDLMDGLYVAIGSPIVKVILINKHRPLSVQTAVLAEEIGHHHTCVGNIVNQNSVINRKCERRGRVWAIRKLIPPEKIKDLIGTNAIRLFDISEEIGLPEDFVREAFVYYGERVGMAYG